VWAAGNFLAVYVDDMNANWQAGAAARANAILAAAQQTFPCGVPEFFVLNEISAGAWPSDAAYRKFVVDLAKELHVTHGKTPIVAAPFDKPGAHAADWQALAAHGFVGAEVYLTGKEINANGNSVAWCQAQYQASITAYGNLGVAKNRLYIFENFANTKASSNKACTQTSQCDPDEACKANVCTVSFGRAGVSAAGWNNAITARSNALKNLGLAGFVSYAWGGNRIHAPESDRLGFMASYVAANLP
ncbi:MAG: hypothetical protein U0263_33175, partial [Polyangiaceae bacterium]